MCRLLLRINQKIARFKLIINALHYVGVGVSQWALTSWKKMKENCFLKTKFQCRSVIHASGFLSGKIFNPLFNFLS